MWRLLLNGEIILITDEVYGEDWFSYEEDHEYIPNRVGEIFNDKWMEPVRRKLCAADFLRLPFSKEDKDG